MHSQCGDRHHAFSVSARKLLWWTIIHGNVDRKEPIYRPSHGHSILVGVSVSDDLPPRL